jgi:hypothetical protein
MQVLLRTISAAWLALVAAGVFRGCGPLPTPTASPTSDAAAATETASTPTFPEDSDVIAIVHTNDVRGEVDPCG